MKQKLDNWLSHATIFYLLKIKSFPNLVIISHQKVKSIDCISQIYRLFKKPVNTEVARIVIHVAHVQNTYKKKRYNIETQTQTSISIGNGKD